MQVIEGSSAGYAPPWPTRSGSQPWRPSARPRRKALAPKDTDRPVRAGECTGEHVGRGSRAIRDSSKGESPGSKPGDSHAPFDAGKRCAILMTIVAELGVEVVPELRDNCQSKKPLTSRVDAVIRHHARGRDNIASERSWCRCDGFAEEFEPCSASHIFWRLCARRVLFRCCFLNGKSATDLCQCDRAKLTTIKILS